MLRRLAGLTVLVAATMLAQTDGLIATVARSVALAPSEAHVEVSVITEGGRTLDYVTAKLADVGFSTSHLYAIYPASQIGPSPSQSRVAWQFRRPAPLADLSKINEALERLRRSDLEVEIQYRTVAVTGTGASEAREAAAPEMLAEARRRVESMAKTAGVGVGRLLSMVITSSEAPPGIPGPLQVVLSMTVRYEIQ